MKARLNHYTASPESFKAMMAFEEYVQNCGLEYSLRELVKTRASMINGCAFCVHMHTNDALKAGESVDRLMLLSAWRESPLYTARERAALAWTDAVTLVSSSNVPDDVYAEVREHFSEEEMVKLTLAVSTINIWNRFAIAFRAIHPTTPNKA